MTRRGRPSGAGAPLSEAVLVDAAELLLERGGWEAVSVRAVARLLRVDPMALYHHLPGREALLAALAERRFGALDPGSPPFDPGAPWRERVQALAALHLGLARRAPALVRALAADPEAAASVAAHWVALFTQATAGLELGEEDRLAGAALLADYIHGYTLSPAAGEEGFRRGLGLVLDGLEARARGGLGVEEHPAQRP